MNNEIMVRPFPTPNPNAIKFVTNKTLKEQGKASFESKDECIELPLFSDIFLMDGVQQVFVFQNAMTVTHDGTIDPQELIDDIIAILNTRFNVHDPYFLTESEEAVKEVKDRSHLPPEIQKIEEILDRTIRPGLNADGGDLEIISLEGDDLTITYLGACGTCPSSMMGTLDAIQGILSNEYSESIKIKIAEPQDR